MEVKFEIALREKYRFQHKGSISTEDLWDLSLNDLDNLHRGLNVELRDLDIDESLGGPNSTVQRKADTLAAKKAIVRHVYEIKAAEREAAKQAKEKAERKRRILAIIAEKQDEATRNMSIDELNNLLAAL